MRAWALWLAGSHWYSFHKLALSFSSTTVLVLFLYGKKKIDYQLPILLVTSFVPYLDLDLANEERNLVLILVKQLKTALLVLVNHS